VPVAGVRRLPFLGHDLDFGQQRLHQLFRLHLPDQLACLEQDPVALSAGDANVGFLALADPVDDAAPTPSAARGHGRAASRSRWPA